MSGNRPRVIVLAFAAPSKRVKDYAEGLLAQGVAVDLITSAAEPWRAAGLDRAVRIHAVHEAEEGHPVRRVENLLLYRIPGRILFDLRRSRLGPAADQRLEQLRDLHRRAAGRLHRAFYHRVYNVLRPLVIARAARRPLQAVDFGRVERIVAADIYAVTLSWELARRFPDVAATTALEAWPPAGAGPAT